MNRSWLFVAALTMQSVSAAHAEDGLPTDCSAIDDNVKRLACYDDVAGRPARPSATLPQLMGVAPGAVPVSSPAPASQQPAQPPSQSAPSGSTDDAVTVTTKEITAQVSPADFKVADPADLHVAPRKFRNKPVEIRHSHCYYADENDYRCIAPGFQAVAVFSPSIAPLDEKSKLDADCGAIKAMMTAKCERTIHITFDDYDEDQVDAMTHRIILKPAVITIVAAPNRRKR